METMPLKIFPRRKQGQTTRAPDVSLTYERVSSFFHMRLEDAAHELVRAMLIQYDKFFDLTQTLQGISLTALRSACRRLGIERWPYSRSGREAEEANITLEDNTVSIDTERGDGATEVNIAEGESHEDIEMEEQQNPDYEVHPRSPTASFVEWYVNIPLDSEEV
ncbi:hypothetical protein GUITHDRAFT_111328 [Guillardia theta CCMP2712]|uniref:RWP-RK domain-containing protein n=1 Tax=Guillardia theta (strain CCMP2712) TaxID=905079 RepID=L1J3D3_GUITC|nr:hypothetical protein GUITHDRAFT_111328 [Guillardia theta CCMP2712]EKX42649.1 hypothetical protein GUITHDRAFT_111328 [Guillardia theta CCMP2712]|eukprot:XP_005829629.1 hypothetical protein GUITHDRAFT_111328 [Guillardia theta CCMP2712]